MRDSNAPVWSREVKGLNLTTAGSHRFFQQEEKREREERGGDGKWKHKFEATISKWKWRHLTILSNINKVVRLKNTVFFLVSRIKMTLLRNTPATYPFCCHNTLPETAQTLCNTNL